MFAHVVSVFFSLCIYPAALVIHCVAPAVAPLTSTSTPLVWL